MVKELGVEELTGDQTNKRIGRRIGAVTPRLTPNAYARSNNPLPKPFLSPILLPTIPLPSSPSPFHVVHPNLTLHVLEVGIVGNAGDFAAEVGEFAQPVPATQQVVGRGGEHAAGVHRLAPVGPADLLDHLRIRQPAEIPRAAQTHQKVDFLLGRIEPTGRRPVRIQCAIDHVFVFFFIAHC